MSETPKEYKVVCRGSLLSRAQAEYFVDKLKTHTGSKFTIVVKDTAGDLDQQKLLQDMDGKDFFTKDIQDFLVDGHADFAVHSLKDVSSESFFNDNKYAVINREDPRDVAIFNDDVVEKLSKGISLRLGTSSPRRALMAVRFLQKALPTINDCQPKVQAEAIRGNVDTRLQKLSDGQYDGIVLAMAGLNRLLHYPPAIETVTRLLRGKKFMVLPLIECPPAAGQGIVVAETTAGNMDARHLLEMVNDAALLDDTRHERAMAAEYGAGCHQQFSVIHISTRELSFTFGAGLDSTGNPFEKYEPHPQLVSTGKKIFSAGDHMKALFRYSYPSQPAAPDTKALFVGSQHAVHSDDQVEIARRYRMWAAGTKTWTELAKKGLWVEGCADALGLESIEHWFSGPMIGLSRNDITILTDTESTKSWEKDGWKASGNYSVEVERSAAIESQIAQADIIFWTSFRQFKTYRDVVKPDSIHCCSIGKTASHFRDAGITPVVFAGIKGFNEWRNQTHSTAT